MGRDYVFYRNTVGFDGTDFGPPLSIFPCCFLPYGMRSPLESKRFSSLCHSIGSKGRYLQNIEKILHRTDRYRPRLLCESEDRLRSAICIVGYPVSLQFAGGIFCSSRFCLPVQLKRFCCLRMRPDTGRLLRSGLARPLPSPDEIPIPGPKHVMIPAILRHPH